MENKKDLKHLLNWFAILAAFLLLGSACAEKPKADGEVAITPEEEIPVVPPPEDPATTPPSSFFVYVASGATYAGQGITPIASSQTISKYNDKGQFVALIRDYVATGGDQPVALLDYSNTHLLVLVDSPAGDRLELVAKDGSSYQTLFGHANLTGTMRDISYDGAGNFIVSRATGIEKFTGAGVRVTLGANAWVNNPGGDCSSSATNIVDIGVSSLGHILAIHSQNAVGANNRILMIDKAGYSGTANCLAAVSAPTTSHVPTALLVHSSNRALVFYSNNTGPIHQVYNYPLSDASIGSGILSFSDVSVLQAVTKMVELPDGNILAANAHASFNTVERLSLDPATGALSRVGSAPFIAPSVYTRQISSMLVAGE